MKRSLRSITTGLLIIALLPAFAGACRGLSAADCGPGEGLFTCRVHILPGMLCGSTCQGWSQDVTNCALNPNDAANIVMAGVESLVAQGYYRNVGIHGPCWPGTSVDVPPFPGPLAWCDPTVESCDGPPTDSCQCGPL